MTKSLIFTTPDIKYKDTFIKGIEEFQKEKEQLYHAVSDDALDINDLRNNFEKYLEKWDKDSKGIDLKEGRVPQTKYWLIVDDVYVGQVSFRHYLNDNLLKMGGHIGYGVIPSERKKGYGTELLKYALTKAKEMKLEKVLVTCNEDNTGSRKVIEKNKGVLENIIPQEEGKPNKCRFWINL